jgi:hypothetical protein
MVVKMAQAINIQKYHLEENDFRFGWNDFDLPFMSSSTVGVFSIVTSDVLALLPCRRNDGVWRFGVTMALVLKKLEISLKGGRIQMVTHTHMEKDTEVYLLQKKGMKGSSISMTISSWISNSQHAWTREWVARLKCKATWLNI